MKTLRSAEEIMELIGFKVKEFESPSVVWKVSDAIKLAQREAIEAAAENAMAFLDVDDNPIVSKGSILNLLNPSSKQVTK